MAITSSGLTRAIAVAACAALTAGPALGHPHVWVGTKSQAVFENGTLTALRFTWLFDEMYTTAAVEGLDANKDGKLDAAELEELIKINMEGLKEFEYFTVVTMGGQPAQFGEPTAVSMEVLELEEAPGPQMVAGPGLPVTAAPATPPAEQQGAWMRFKSWIAGLFGRSPVPAPAQSAKPAQPAEKSKVLALHMTLPLKSPVPPAQLDGSEKGFRFTTSDQQMYIWFEPMPRDGISLAPGAPDGCRLAFVEPEQSEEQKRLADAFGRSAGMAIASSQGKSVAVICAGP